MNTIKETQDNKQFKADKALRFYRCFARRSDGHLCKRHPVRGQAFCQAHLKQGYALFTLAVISATREKAHDQP